MSDRPTREELNAYVDGELSAQDDARIAEAIAREPGLADRVAALTRLKSALAETAEAPARPIVLPRSGWSRGMLAVAASVALLIMVSVATGIALFGTEDANWFDEARNIHTDWARYPASPEARKVDADSLLVSLDRIDLPVHTPDLTSARLRLTYLEFYAETENALAAIHLGYTGRRGCRVTLWVTAAPRTLTTALMESRDGKLRGYRWRVGRVAYALFATGMAESRFTMIAGKVYKSTREHRGFDEETRMALNHASTTAPPCAV